MNRTRRNPKGIRKQIVERSCCHAVIRIKLYRHWYDGDWIYLRFEVKATGDYLIKEAIRLTRQWQCQYSCGRIPLLQPGSHELNAAKLHAVKAIEKKRREFGDQSELFV